MVRMPAISNVMLLSKYGRDLPNCYVNLSVCPSHKETEVCKPNANISALTRVWQCNIRLNKYAQIRGECTLHNNVPGSTDSTMCAVIPLAISIILCASKGVRFVERLHMLVMQ